MPTEKLTAAYWNKKTEIIEASVRGWDPLQRLPVLLQEAYPELKNVKFGFFIEDDLPERHSIGWELFTKEFFDADELNKSVLPARYGLTDDGSGALKWRDNYLMIMHKNFRAQLMAARNAHSEEKYSSSITGQKYTAPSDPRGAEMAEYAESSLDSKIVQPKRGPGRPPKQK